MSKNERFLSTLPARGATAASLFVGLASPFLSTLPARGATLPQQPGGKRAGRTISIHAPREGSDTTSAARRKKSRENHFYPRSPRGERLLYGRLAGPTPFEFLSTLPARGATLSKSSGCGIMGISIHAPREGSDCWMSLLCSRIALFLSTLPARGATAVIAINKARQAISIHAPREGSDSCTRRRWPWG